MIVDWLTHSSLEGIAEEKLDATSLHEKLSWPSPLVGNEFWLITGEDLWYPPEGNFAQVSILAMSLKITTPKLQMYFPGANELSCHLYEFFIHNKESLAQENTFASVNVD